MYNEIVNVNVLMDKYELEKRVDKKIGVFQNAAREAFWNVASEIGWSSLCQVGEVVSFLQSYSSSFSSSGDSMIVPKRIGNRKSGGVEMGSIDS